MIAVFATCILLTIFQELEALDFNLLGYEIKRDGKKLSNDENSLLDIIMNDPKLERLEDFENEIDPSIALAKITLKGTKNNSFVPSKDPAPVHDNSFQNQTTLYEINNPITKNLPKSTENKMPSKNQTRRTDKVLNTLIPKNVPVIVPARTYFEPVIHDHPPLEVMKKIMNKNKKNYTEYNYDDSSSVTDSGSEIDTSADY